MEYEDAYIASDPPVNPFQFVGIRNIRMDSVRITADAFQVVHTLCVNKYAVLQFCRIVGQNKHSIRSFPGQYFPSVVIFEGSLLFAGCPLKLK